MEFIPRSAPAVVPPAEARRHLIREIGVAAVAASLAMMEGAAAAHDTAAPAASAPPRAA